MKLRDVASVAIILVIAGMSLGIGAEVLREVGKKGVTTSVTNESQTFTKDTCKQMNYGQIASVTRVDNYTGEGNQIALLSGTNYDICGDGGLQIYTNTSYPGTQFNVSYDGRMSKAWQATLNASVGSAELADWIPTIGLVVAAALVVAIIFASFLRGGIGGV